MQEDEIIKQPTFTDSWGYTYNWTDLAKGWTVNRRRQVLNLRAEMKSQMSEMPHFTKTGIKKTKMSDELHKYILENRNISEGTKDIIIIFTGKTFHSLGCVYAKRNSDGSNYV